LLDQLVQQVDAVVGQVVLHAAGADVRVVHAQAGQRLGELEDALPLTKTHLLRRGGAQFEAVCAHTGQVRGDAVGLKCQDPQLLAAPRQVIGDTQQLLDRQRVDGFVVDAGDVVHPRPEGGALRPGAELGILLDPGMQEADAGPATHHGFAVQLEQQPHHAVGGRVLGAQVDDDDLVRALSLRLDDLRPIVAGSQICLIDGGFTCDGEDVLVAGDAEAWLGLLAHAW